MFVELHPEVAMVGTSSMVLNPKVIRIGHPESRWHLVSIKHTKGRERTNTQIPNKAILGLDAILKEISMSLYMISDVLDYSEVMTAMNGQRTIE